MYKATIIKTKYDDEEWLIIKDEKGNELINQYFDYCEPYITPSDFINIVRKLGVECEVEYKEEY